jgi:hypothetical protein
MIESRKTKLIEWIETTGSNWHSSTSDATSSGCSVDYHSADGSYSSTNSSARIHHCHSTDAVCFVASSLHACIVDDQRLRNSATNENLV